MNTKPNFFRSLSAIMAEALDPTGGPEVLTKMLDKFMAEAEVHVASILGAIDELEVAVADAVIENSSLRTALAMSVIAMYKAQSHIASCRPEGSSDANSKDYNHDSFLWDYFGNAIQATNRELT